MQAPEQMTPQGPADYLAVMTKAVFQAGISWQVIEAKWPGFVAAFDGFDPARVAALTPEDVDRLAADTRMVRNRRKIEATVDNAATMLELAAEHGDFPSYLHAQGDFEATVAALRRDFRYLGDFGAYYLLYVVGEDVPAHDDFRASRARA